MTDFFWLCIAAIACICIAYGLGIQIGYKRGYRDWYYKKLFEKADSVIEWKQGGKEK